MPTPTAQDDIGELHLSNAAHLELLRAVTDRGAAIRTPVHGCSMAPFIRDGDVLTIAPMAGRMPKVGEVVAVCLPEDGRLVVHRVVRRRKDGWVIRGDKCSAGDGVVGREHVLGRVVRAERRGRDVRLGVHFGNRLIVVLTRGRVLGLLRWSRRALRSLAAPRRG